MERLSKEQLDTIELPLLEWIHEQASIRHMDLVRAETIITERGYTLFAIYFGILTASVGYVLTHLNVKDDMALTSGCLSLIVFSCIAIGFIYKVIEPHGFYAPGKEPDNFKIADYITYFNRRGIVEESQKKQVIGDELVNLQNKITQQDELNKKRVEHTRTSIRFILFGSLMAIITFLIALFIS
jgi:hypothetical protein